MNYILNNITFIVAQIFGLTAWFLLLYSFKKEEIDELLKVQIIAYIFDVASYLLLGADAGLCICILELVKSILYYKTDKDDLIFKISLFVYVLIGLLTIKHWFAILPVLASAIDSWGCSRDSKSANISSIFANALWAVYDYLILSYIGTFNDIVVILCNISILFLGYSRLLKIEKFRIVKYTYLNKKTLKKILKLDTKTFGKDNTWPSMYQIAVFKRNKDSLLVIKYKHEFIGYINYLNILESEYNRIKRTHKRPEILELDKIIPYKANRKNYVLIETINVNKEYEKDKTIELIDKKIKSFINLKKHQKIYIHNMLAFADNEFEVKVLEFLGFTKIKEYNENSFLYEKTF